MNINIPTIKRADA
jgi:hypothetical protein